MTEVLDAVADEAAWLEWWRQSTREPQAHPAYSRLLAAPDHRPVAILHTSQAGSALVPLVLRPVPGVADRWDAISPYGYGGPFLRGEARVEQVLDAVAGWAAGAGLCSVFLRLSLGAEVAEGRRSSGVQVDVLSENVVVDLRRTEDELWMGYEHKVRKNVNKAMRAGCTVSRSEAFDDLDAFLDVYGETMARRSADEWFRFDRAWFAAWDDELAGSYSVFVVRDATGRPVSVELVLEGDDHLYSFLGGTRADAFSLSPNDLLKHEVIRYGQRTARRGFVLGGGFRPGDGIYRYKRSFDPRGTAPFRAVRIVADVPLYDRLTAERVRQGGAADSPFFPAYRAPGASVD